MQVATERMIARLEVEGGYSEDFMAEFRTFRSELRDFFNASSLTDMLAALRPSLDESDMQVGWQGICFN
jgi:phosphoglucan, water dikinase